MPGMEYYPSTPRPHGEVIDTALDISSTVLATLTAASQYAPLPFLQEASFLALAILNTVKGAKDNKEAFKSLANDACELVSAIVCVYNDMEKDGQKPSLGLKKRVDELISLLKSINHFSQKHIARSTMYRMVRLSSENAKIQQYRGRLRQALDVFGLQSSISIHETVVEILKELREREPFPEPQDQSGSSSPLEGSPFASLLQGNITGNISINTINGNQEVHSTSHHTTIVDSYNHMNFSSPRPWDHTDSY
ncbi:hypothetical protein DFH07DRAFT_803570 [Mycena maculata]|uniref:Uncharacterized protein n=1 Tax=Mycena maculata TaxID=230809 RepID=A0AAD7NR41_9AGAR|nr:hypothetical protein DFH07DRAFT_803570 [Mycena maculata]